MKVDLIIFDMDGLMIDTEPASKEGWRAGLEHFGFELDEELYVSLIGRGINAAKILLSEKYGAAFDFDVARKIRAEQMEIYLEQHGGLSMKKGLLPLLDCLDNLKIPKCVATSTERESMERKLIELGLFDRFDGFITGDQVKLGKPNPEVFLKAAELTGAIPENCIVLEDSPAGINAAHNAHMPCIMVPDMISPDDDIKSKVYAICNDLEEVAGIIAKLSS
ncbi:MAG: HAD family phosphatase [Firmicutes bacterium]|nr:HAD family phosphatase [Bacillota bacterium]